MVQKKDSSSVVNKKQAVRRTSPKKDSTDTKIIYKHTWSAPLPPPEYLAGYKEIHPDFANRLIIEFEKQGNHRRSVENDLIKARTMLSKRGQNWAAVILLVSIICGTFLIYYDKKVYGLVLIILHISSIVGTFLWRDYKNRQEEEKVNHPN